MNRQVERMVRSLDVRAAHAHARASTGQPFVAARSEINGAASSAASALSSRKQRAFGWRTPSYPLRTRTVGMSRLLKRAALQWMAAIGAAAEAVASGRGIRPRIAKQRISSDFPLIVLFRQSTISYILLWNVALECAFSL